MILTLIYLLSASTLLMMRLAGTVIIVRLLIIKSINNGASLSYASFYQTSKPSFTAHCSPGLSVPVQQWTFICSWYAMLVPMVS
jgi:hypothetical protein